MIISKNKRVLFFTFSKFHQCKESKELRKGIIVRIFTNQLKIKSLLLKKKHQIIDKLKSALSGSYPQCRSNWLCAVSDESVGNGVIDRNH